MGFFLVVCMVCVLSAVSSFSLRLMELVTSSILFLLMCMCVSWFCYVLGLWCVVLRSFYFIIHLLLFERV